MVRDDRQIKILELIEQQDIETQDELLSELQKSGYAVTQATISRDIKELALIKVVTSDKRQKYVREIGHNLNVSAKVISMFCHAVVSIDQAQNLVVIKTLPGAASSAGAMVDRINVSGVLGCVAGDDTVLVVAKTIEVAKEIVDKLNNIIA